MSNFLPVRDIMLHLSSLESNIVINCSSKEIFVLLCIELVALPDGTAKKLAQLLQAGIHVHR